MIMDAVVSMMYPIKCRNTFMMRRIDNGFPITDEMAWGSAGGSVQAVCCSTRTHFPTGGGYNVWPESAIPVQTRIQ